MVQIVYTSKAQRFADDFQRELIASGIRELISELQERLSRLEAFELQPSSPIPNSGENSTKLVVENPPRKKCGRPKKPEPDWKAAGYSSLRSYLNAEQTRKRAARKAEKQRRHAEVMANPAVQQLTDTVWKLSGKQRPSQDKTNAVPTSNASTQDVRTPISQI